MNRQEDNGILIDNITEKVKNKPKGTYQEVVTFNLGAIVSILTDISKSLAIIADKAESEDQE